MLDDATKAQLKSYLERATAPIEIVASLDDSEGSGEMLSLLKDVAEASPLVKLTESRDDKSPQAFVLHQPPQRKPRPAFCRPAHGA
jgi:alkyl hydroperoxide reductase subunit F